MTTIDIERLRMDVKFQKGCGHSKAKLHINQLERVLDLAAQAAAMSETERAAARKHMERSRQVGAFT